MTASNPSIPRLGASRLINRWSQPLAVAMTRCNLMKQFFMFATLGFASGGSAFRLMIFPAHSPPRAVPSISQIPNLLDSRQIHVPH